MSRDECKLPTCSAEPGQQDRDDYRTGSFCSVMHELKYEDLKADAEAARRSSHEPAAEREGRV